MTPEITPDYDERTTLTGFRMFFNLLASLATNVPFRFATGLYMLNWITFDLVALMLPFFLVYWVAQGNLLASINIFGENIALESVVLGLLLTTAVIALPLWTWLSNRLNKRSAYIIGMSFWAVVQILLVTVQPGETSYVLGLAVLAGLSVSTAHVLPDAIFPDVIEWDELRTRHRHEGIYYPKLPHPKAAGYAKRKRNAPESRIKLKDKPQTHKNQQP